MEKYFLVVSFALESLEAIKREGKQNVGGSSFNGFSDVWKYWNCLVMTLFMCRCAKWYLFIKMLTFGKTSCCRLLNAAPWSPIIWSIYVQENIAGFHLAITHTKRDPLTLAFKKFFSLCLEVWIFLLWLYSQGLFEEITKPWVYSRQLLLCPLSFCLFGWRAHLCVVCLPLHVSLGSESRG